jgi:hypothetical protein
MPSTYTPIATTTLTSTENLVTFNSFSGYTDLVIVASVKNTGSSVYVVSWGGIRFNGDTTANKYSNTSIVSSTAGAGSISTDSSVSNALACANVFRTDHDNFNTTVIHIPNYASTTTYKNALGTSTGSMRFVFESIGIWKDTAAITSLTLVSEDSSASRFAIGSTFTLYGILAA